MIQVAELICLVTVKRSQVLAPLQAPAVDVAPAPVPAVDARHIADLVYRMMRDDLAILRERA